MKVGSTQEWGLTRLVCKGEEAQSIGKQVLKGCTENSKLGQKKQEGRKGGHEERLN